MLSFLGFGDNVADVYINQGKMYPGGNALNFAIFAAKLGYRSAFMGIFGDDAPAKMIYNAAFNNGLDMSHCRFERGESGICKVELVNGDRKFVYSNHGGISDKIPLSLTELDYQYMQGFDLIHTSVFSKVDMLLPEMRRRGFRISYDFSDKFNVKSLTSAAPYLFCACISASHLKGEEICDIAEILNKLGCTITIATIGAKGALLFYKGKSFYQSAYIVPAIDTMAAGDCMITAFLTRFLEGMEYAPSVLSDCGYDAENDEFEQNLIKSCLSQGSVFAAMNCRQYGSFGYGEEFNKIS